ncbi:MAG: hypothetical protein WC936_07030 [Candidatus Nanoarchaeia archaeon]|jgi:NTP pyrophosphatase (non-canonical NTP hydrolase)
MVDERMICELGEPEQVPDVVNYHATISWKRFWKPVEPAPPKDWVELRPSVLRFAQLMEKNLRAHDDKGGWDNCNVIWLVERMQEELVELEDAMIAGAPDDIDDEAADVANFLMMIAENLRKEWDARKSGAI